MKPEKHSWYMSDCVCSLVHGFGLADVEIYLWIIAGSGLLAAYSHVGI